MFETRPHPGDPHNTEVRHYPVVMTVSAHDVAAAIRDRLPDIGAKKLHKLLYYCQGHHLAAFGTPLFSETISAWDMGPVVGSLWYEEKQGLSAPRAELSNGQLNTIGYVISRYGKLTGNDLENLTHAETPWQTANRDRLPHDSARIDLGVLKEYFVTDGAAGDDDDLPVDSDEIRSILKEAETRQARTPRPDDIDALRARVRRMRAELGRSA